MRQSAVTLTLKWSAKSNDEMLKKDDQARSWWRREIGAPGGASSRKTGIRNHARIHIEPDSNARTQLDFDLRPIANKCRT
jgi:hypothetical protein